MFEVVLAITKLLPNIPKSMASTLISNGLYQTRRNVQGTRHQLDIGITKGNFLMYFKCPNNIIYKKTINKLKQAAVVFILCIFQELIVCCCYHRNSYPVNLWGFLSLSNLNHPCISKLLLIRVGRVSGKSVTV